MSTTRAAADPFATAEHRPLWQATMPPMPAVLPHALPDTADVVVVGGGFTGLSAGRELARGGASVVLVDAETLGWGASTRNGGMVLSGFHYGIDGLTKKYGRELGLALQAETVESVDHVARLSETEGIDADMRREGHLDLAYTPQDAKELQEVADGLAAAGSPARFVPRKELRAEIGTDEYFGGLLVPNDGGVHPGKLTVGLANRAVEAGVDVHERTRATAIRPQKDGRVVVETSRGAVIARHVVVGTNGYTDAAAPGLRRRLVPISSYVIATDVLDPELLASVSPKGRMFFDTKFFLYYWRTTADGRVLFGGRASFWPMSDEKAGAILYRGMTQIHPQLAGVAVKYLWSGKVAFTYDRMPHAGRSGEIFYVTGCCGNGVALFPYIGTKIARWMSGGPGPAISKIGFPLVPAPYEGRTWFLPFVGEWYRMKDRRKARHRADILAEAGPAGGGPAA
jgi:glycine/D-amino acid oxidase-like deaminating enzyme